MDSNVFCLLDSLQRYFEKYGEIKECVVMRDAVTKRSRFVMIIF